MSLVPSGMAVPGALSAPTLQAVPLPHRGHRSAVVGRTALPGCPRAATWRANRRPSPPRQETISSFADNCVKQGHLASSPCQATSPTPREQQLAPELPADRLLQRVRPGRRERCPDGPVPVSRRERRHQGDWLPELPHPAAHGWSSCLPPRPSLVAGTAKGREGGRTQRSAPSRLAVGIVRACLRGRAALGLARRLL